MNKNSVRPFGLRDKLGYLFGDFGNDFTFVLCSTFLLKFYTDVIGVSAVVVGTVMMLARFLDAFTDIAMGRICDRSRYTKHGKFKPWILRMCVPVALSSFFIYQSSLASAETWVKITYLFITYILWSSVFYTSVNIPYGSMASSISENPGDRQSLSTYRTMGGMLAGMVISIGVPLIAYNYDADNNPILDGKKFTIIAAVFSVLAILCYLLCFFLVTERVRVHTTEENRKKNSVIRMFKNVLKNRALLSIITASIVMLLAQLTIQGISPYIFPNYYRNTAAQSIATLMMGVSMLLAASIAKPLSERFGKAEISIASNLFATAICAVLFFLRPENVWVYVALQTIEWFGLGVFSMVNWALITDVIDYSELKNGIREDGAIYAIYSFARKLGQAASAGLTGLLLSLVNYSTETAFDTDVVNGIFDISTLVPAIGFLVLALILAFWYPLHKNQVDANVRLLKEKRNKEQSQ